MNYLQIGLCNRKFLQGEFTDLNVWSKPIQSTSIVSFVQDCKITDPPDVIVWEKKISQRDKLITQTLAQRTSFCTGGN